MAALYVCDGVISSGDLSGRCVEATTPRYPCSTTEPWRDYRENCRVTETRTQSEKFADLAREVGTDPDEKALG
jgi:hypothetical protein